MTPLHLGLAILANAVWGYAYVAAKLGVEAYPPIFFTALRWLIITLLLARFLSWPRGHFRVLVLISLTMGALHYAMLYTGFYLSGDVASVAIVSQLSVPFATLLGVAFMGERIGWRRAAAIAVAFAGVGVIGFDPDVFSHLAGVVLVGVSAAMFACGSALINRAKALSTWSIQAWMGALSGPQLLLFSLVLEDGQWEALVHPTVSGVWALSYAIVGTSIVGLGIWYFLLQRYPVSLVSPIGLLSPIFGVLAGVVFMGDGLSTELLLGGGLTLGGVGYIMLRAAQRGGAVRAASAAAAKEQA
ncbi:MAG: EamA/RhaT family transporter [Alphaproteobacteria bacterium]|nr:EamA/RhaT family transporter [Alphaproteobacteria bacterium]